jgi:hypothetical protein
MAAEDSLAEAADSPVVAVGFLVAAAELPAEAVDSPVAADTAVADIASR